MFGLNLTNPWVMVGLQSFAHGVDQWEKDREEKRALQQDLLRRRLDRIDRQAGSDIALEQWKKQHQYKLENVPAPTQNELFNQQLAERRFKERQDVNEAQLKMGRDQRDLAEDKFERVPRQPRTPRETQESFRLAGTRPGRHARGPCP